jgi:hypothetical protein
MPKYSEFKSKPIKGLAEENWGKLSAGQFNRVINIDWETQSLKRTANTDYKAAAAKRDYKAIVAKIDYKASQEKRAINTDYKTRTANTDYQARNAKTNYKERNKKLMKSISQFDLQNNFIRDWDSAIQAEKELNLSSGGIGACCLGKQKKAFGFIWKFKLEQN